MRSRVLAVVAAFVLTAVASAPPALGQTATTTYLFNIVHGAVWRGDDGIRYLTVGCAPLERKSFGASDQDSVVTLRLQVVALPRSTPDWVVWRSSEGQQCNLRKGIDSVTFSIPEGLGLDANHPYIPIAYPDPPGRFRIGGTHGRAMYRLRDYSGSLRGPPFTPSPPGGIK